MDGKERRKDDASVSELLLMMRSLHEDFQSQAQLLLDVKKDITDVLAAFPLGGLVNHRLFHEKQISDQKDAHDLRQTLIKNLSTWGVIGTVGTVLAALWVYFQVKVGVPTK